MSFDLEKQDELFRDLSREEIRREKHKNFNNKQKNVMRYIGENMASYACLLIVVLLIGFIWTDMRAQVFSERMVIDAIVTITMFIFAEYFMSQNGIRCGKSYDEYINNHVAYLNLRASTYKIGIMLMDIFCDWQIDVEYEFYIRRKCKRYKINYDDYCNVYSKMSTEDLKAVADVKRYRGKTLREIDKMLTPKKAARVIELNAVKPIELTPEILLTDGKARTDRGGVGMSGEEFAERKTTHATHIILSIITGIVSVLPAFVLNDGASWELVVYTLFKLVMLMFRMYKGYMNGTKAFNTVEVKHLQDKIKYLNLYHEFINKKIYIKLGDKYGSIPGYEEGYESPSTIE